MIMNLLAKTYFGLEEVLAKELTELGADNIQISRRAVYFDGDLALLYRANLQIRSAIRILRPLITFKATSADEIYENLRKFDFTSVMSVNNTFIINETVNSESIRNSQFVKYRTKDAIVDFFNEKFNRRPNVSVQNPDIYFDIHVSHDMVTLSLDSSGESLHLRGWRADQTVAPISEVLAAGMLLMTGWHGECDLIDPMCGSGTILIEAALLALNMPPCIYRKHFAFERWNDFDADLFNDIYNDESVERPFEHKIYGYDIDPKAVAVANRNIKSAGLSKYISVELRPVEEFVAPTEPAIWVSNPPYGKRIVTDDMYTLYRNIGSALKHKFVGNSAWIISSEKSLLSAIGMKPSEKIKLINGDLECEFCHYEVFAGRRNDYVREKKENEPADETKEVAAEKTDRDSKPSFRKSSDRKPFARKTDDRKPKFSDGKSKRPYKSDKPKSHSDKPDFKSDKPNFRRKDSDAKPFRSSNDRKVSHKYSSGKGDKRS